MTWNYNMDEAPRDGTRILVSYVGRNGPRLAVAHWDGETWKGGEILLHGVPVPFTLHERPPYAWMIAPEVAEPRS